MKPLLKRYLHLLGGALGIAGIFFIAARLYKYAGQIHLARFSETDWLLLFLLACVYGAANVLLAMAWKRLLDFLDAPVSNRWAIRIYGISLLAKYVPGNIFQFASRQAIGMSAGVAGPPLFKSALYELGLLATIAGFFGLLVLPLMWSTVPAVSMLLCLGGVLAGAGWWLTRHVSRHLAAASWLYALFLAISGLTFWGILWVLAPDHQPSAPVITICGAYVLAWLAGLVTPGAPAGIGVREAALLFLLGNLIAPDHLLLALILGRMVTVIGDLLFFFSIHALQLDAHDTKQ